MSMLSSQADELREAAGNFEGYQNGEISRMLREAADTIISLRDRLQDAEPGRGTCELHDCEGSFSAVGKPVWRCDCGAFMTQYTDATTYHKPRYCPNCGREVER